MAPFAQSSISRGGVGDENKIFFFQKIQKKKIFFFLKKKKTKIVFFW